MQGYRELATIYDKKFLNYIISRSKSLSSVSTFEYDDLVQDGLEKLVTLHAKKRRMNDPMIMESLKNMYNNIYERKYKSRPTLISYEETMEVK